MKTKINSAFLAVFFTVLASLGISNQSMAQAQSEDAGLVKMYYFHFNTRCETCRAVESEAQQDVQLLFGDDVTFTAVNLDKKEGEETGKRLGVNSQMLLIVKGDTRINLTNEGFMYALTDPDKFRDIIEAKIKPLM
ncbi:MAG TPA: nitrophenyl compound nitroreductase subunit ArsF family protein [Draconibacterium sp.]|nr:nitrophenyl compound nitroreductase subunit ArsF family protein [Draconibacterium sp.]